MNTWYSPVLIAKYNATDRVSIAARAEYYSDKNGVIISTGTTNGFKSSGLSANIDYTLQENTVWRIEARTLSTREKIFERRNTASSN